MATKPRRGKPEGIRLSRAGYTPPEGERLGVVPITLDDIEGGEGMLDPDRDNSEDYVELDRARYRGR